MSTPSCNHDDRKRKKYLIDGAVYVLCEECEASWSAHDRGEAPEPPADLPPAPVDHEALEVEVRGWCLLREEIEFYQEFTDHLRQLARDDLWRIKKQFSTRRRVLSWQYLGEMIGLKKKSIEMYAHYVPKNMSRGVKAYRYTSNRTLTLAQKAQYVRASQQPKERESWAQRPN